MQQTARLPHKKTSSVLVHGSTTLCWTLVAFSVSCSITQSVGLLGRGISPSQGRYLHRTAQTENKSTQTSMSYVGFEPTIPMFELAKTVYPLDFPVTVTGFCTFKLREI
jgi:hypothetical protein